MRPACNGPRVEPASVEPGVTVVVDVVEPTRSAVPSSWSTSGAGRSASESPNRRRPAASGAATAATNPNCSCRPGFLRMAASMASTGGRYGAPMATTRDITYEADGRTMIGTLALPDGAVRPRPGVLVCHEGPGLDDHARDRAPSGSPTSSATWPSLSTTTVRESPSPTATQMMARIGELRSDPARAFAVGTAGLDILCGRAAHRPATVWPPSASASAARSPWSWPAAGPTSRPSSASTPASPPCTPRMPATSPARCWPSSAPTTPWCTPTSGGPSRRRCGPAGSTGSSNVYGGAVHSFTNPRASLVDIPGIAYDEATDRRSWQAMVDLFYEVFG